MLTSFFDCGNMWQNRITKRNNMNLAHALKQKTRIAGELVRQQQILQRENARRNDSPSKVDREQVWKEITRLADELGELKGKITRANVNIYPTLEHMAELKARISFVQGLQKREGEEIIPLHGDREPLKYTWNSFVNQAKCDELVADLQEEINELQDEVDDYNATTQISQLPQP